MVRNADRYDPDFTGAEETGKRQVKKINSYDPNH
jgi:ABC-type cobalt transport system substrate-binding protein